jgi:hypothetical protein
MVNTFVMLDVLRDVIVGSDAGTGERVYLSQVPQDAAYPYAVIEIISRTEAPTQDVGSAVDEYRVQIDVAAKPASGNSAQSVAIQNADAIRAAISRMDLGGNGFYSVQETNMRTDYLPELGVFIASNDYIVRVVAEQGD